jgi:hypothetical protein
MSATSHEDVDVVVQTRKLPASGKILESLNWSTMPHPQPQLPDKNMAKLFGV